MIDPRDIKAFTNAPEEVGPGDTDLLLLDRSGTIKYTTVANLKDDFPEAPTFAVRQNSVTADGATTSFSLPVGVTNKEEIVAFDGGVQTRDFTLDSDQSGITFNYTPTAGNKIDLIVVGTSSAQLLQAASSLQFLDRDEANTIDLTLEANWTNWKTGSAWTAQYTHTLTGTPPDGLAFTFANNSGFTQLLDSTLFDVTTPIKLVDDRSVTFVVNPSTGQLQVIGWGWVSGSSIAPTGAIQDMGSIGGAVTVDYRLGNIVKANLGADVTSVTFNNMSEGERIDLLWDLDGNSLTLPSGVMWDGGSAPAFGSGDLWIGLLKVSDDTSGGTFRGTLHGKDMGD